MELIVTGLNHKTSPVEVREKINFSSSETICALEELKKKGEVQESLILSTCNRTELYACMSNEKREGGKYIWEFISQFKNLSVALEDGCFYTFQAEDAVRHLFEVACGLDSMIVGENQILGQTKNAYHLCCEAKTNGVILNKLFHWAFSVGKRARTETNIGIGTVSVSSVATELAQKIFRDLSKHSALLIGAGEAGELTAKCLQERDIGEIFITNRTYSRAEDLANKLHAKAVEFTGMEETLKNVDVVISSTSSQEYIVPFEYMKRIMALRDHRPLFIIDISVPRDFDPMISKLYNVFLYSVDDLQKIVDKNLEKRQAEKSKVLCIIEEESAKFLQWQNTLRVIPIIRGLQKKVEDIRTSELNTNRKNFKKEDWMNLDLLTKSMVKKIVNLPLMKIKEFNEDSQFGLMRLETVRELFYLEDYQEDDEI
jgi:glutamyl-tRNA reductase